MPNPRNPYDVLNVAQSAEPVVIEAAYRALMKKYHPDQGETSGMQASKAAEINRAFALLKDPAQRAAYDHQEWKRQQALRTLGAPPAPSRRSMARWSGWLVALMLGVLLVAIVMAPKQAVSSGAVAKAQTVAEAESGSQPRHQDLWLPDADGSNEILRQAFDGASVAEPPIPVTAPIVTGQSARRFVSNGSEPRNQKRRRARKMQNRSVSVGRGDGDFLEREGYIY